MSAAPLARRPASSDFVGELLRLVRTPRPPMVSGATALPSAASELGAGAALPTPSSSSASGARASTGSSRRRRRHLHAVESREGPSRAAAPESTSGTPVALSSRAPSAATLKRYLYTEELAELTPWTVDAINTKVKRGELRLGVHYFQPGGRGRRMFKWDAIVDAIEGRALGGGQGTTAPGVETDVAKATAELQRLLD